jgi:hypothetical protein
MPVSRLPAVQIPHGSLKPCLPAKKPVHGFDLITQLATASRVQMDLPPSLAALRFLEKLCATDNSRHTTFRGVRLHFASPGLFQSRKNDDARPAFQMGFPGRDFRLRLSVTAGSGMIARGHAGKTDVFHFAINRLRCGFVPDGHSRCLRRDE